MRTLIVSMMGAEIDLLSRGLRAAGSEYTYWTARSFLDGVPDFSEGGREPAPTFDRVILVIDSRLCGRRAEVPRIVASLGLMGLPVRGLVLEDCLHDFIPELRALPKVDVLPGDGEAERCTAAALELMPGFDQVEEITAKLRGLPFRGWIDTLMKVLEPEEFIATVAAHSTDAAQLRVAVRHLWAAGKLTLLRSSLDMPPLPYGAEKP